MPRRFQTISILRGAEAAPGVCVEATYRIRTWECRRLNSTGNDFPFSRDIGTNECCSFKLTLLVLANRTTPCFSPIPFFNSVAYSNFGSDSTFLLETPSLTGGPCVRWVPGGSSIVASGASI
jgi:hypothetical protein